MTLDEYQILIGSALFKAVYDKPNWWIDIRMYSPKYDRNVSERASEIVLEGEFISLWVGAWHMGTYMKHDVISIKLVEKR